MFNIKNAILFNCWRFSLTNAEAVKDSENISKLLPVLRLCATLQKTTFLLSVFVFFCRIKYLHIPFLDKKSNPKSLFLSSYYILIKEVWDLFIKNETKVLNKNVIFCIFCKPILNIFWTWNTAIYFLRQFPNCIFCITCHCSMYLQACSFSCFVVYFRSLAGSSCMLAFLHWSRRDLLSVKSPDSCDGSRRKRTVSSSVPCQNTPPSLKQTVAHCLYHKPPEIII